MSAPDTTPAFVSEADQTDKDAEIARLRAQLANQPIEGELVDPNTEPDVTAPKTISVHGNEWDYHTPSPGQMMMFGMASARRASPSRRINGIYNFLDATLTDDSYAELESRIADRDTEFGIDEMMELITAIIDAAQSTPEHQAPRTGPTLK